MESIPFRPTRHGTDEGWRKETQFHDPNQLIGHHDRAAKWHKANPVARSDAVVTAGSRRMLWSRWCNHMRWLG